MNATDSKRHAFTAFSHRNYRLWFVGQLVSLMGTWMQNTAQGFLVFELTQSAAYLGYVALAAGLPSWLLMLYGGVVADRVAKRQLLIATQSIMMLLALGLALLTLLGHVQAWHVLVFACLLGTVNAFDAPARQSFVLEMVSKADLTNAIALNSGMFNAAAAVAPAVAGITYAAVGPGYCFLLNAGSFIAVILALSMMKLMPPVNRERKQSQLADLKQGLAYVANEQRIRMLLGLVGATTLLGLSMVTLFPAWSVRVLHGDATTNGLLLSARGAGAMVSAIGLAALGRSTQKGRVLVVNSFIFPIILAAFAFTRSQAASLVVLFVAGASALLVLNLANALVQTLVQDDLRGRIMGVYSLIFIGSMPLGGLVTGLLAEHSSPPMAVMVNAAALLACAIVAWIVGPRLTSLT